MQKMSEPINQQSVQREISLQEEENQLAQMKPMVQHQADAGSIPATNNSVKNKIQRTIDNISDQKNKKKKEISDLAKKIKDEVKGHVAIKSIEDKLNTLHDDQNQNYTVDEAKESVKTSLGLESKEPKKRADLASGHKELMIAPYIALLDHLAGEENKDGSVKGGHLLSDMQIRWGNRLSYEVISGNTNGVWEMQWWLDSGTKKRSTMFPEQWSNQNLRDALRASAVLGNNVFLPNGGDQIKIKKAGDTFYPTS